MRFVLYLTYKDVQFDKFGCPIGIELAESNPAVKYYILENDWDDVDLFFDDHAIDEIANRCDSLISYGEADYFNAEKCTILKTWIDERLQKPADPRNREMLEVLKDYCQQAVELDTGVYIDF